MDMKVKVRIDYMEEREMFDRPDGIIDCAEEIDGALRSWKEYVPSGYDGKQPVPMVVTLHGGSSKKGGNNHRAELSTAWAAVAEREGFIVLYPQSLTPEHAWSAWEDFDPENPRIQGLKDDIRYLDLLMDLVMRKYNIDEERIYLHGQSFGDVMSCFYLTNRKNHRFAAAAPLSGPAGATRYLNEDGSFRFGTECGIPMVRTHGSLDLAMPMGSYQHPDDITPTFDLMKEMKKNDSGAEEIRRAKMEFHQMVNIEFWKHCNASEGNPLLSVRGRYNAVTYPGNYDFHFYMVENGGHGPSMDMADFIWSYFFSGYRRSGGSIINGEPALKFEPDRGAVALADHGSTAYVDNRKVELSGKTRSVNGVYYVPAGCIHEIYPELSVTLEDEGAGAVITDGKRVMQVSASNRTYVWCGYLRHGERTVLDGNLLLVPVCQIAAMFYGQKAKEGHGICYLSEEDGVISYDFGYLVRQLLGTQKQITTQEMWKREHDILENVKQPGV